MNKLDETLLRQLLLNRDCLPAWWWTTKYFMTETSEVVAQIIRNCQSNDFDENDRNDLIVIQHYITSKLGLKIRTH